MSSPPATGCYHETVTGPAPAVFPTYHASYTTGTHVSRAMECHRAGRSLPHRPPLGRRGSSPERPPLSRMCPVRANQHQRAVSKRGLASPVSCCSLAPHTTWSLRVSVCVNKKAVQLFRCQSNLSKYSFRLWLFQGESHGQYVHNSDLCSKCISSAEHPIQSQHTATRSILSSPQPCALES